MKYVKLFESWLHMNEEDGSNEIQNFSPENPRNWPVLKTTVSQLYSGPNSELNDDVLKSILARARQEEKPVMAYDEDGKEKPMMDAEGNPVYDNSFNKFAKINVYYAGLIEGRGIEEDRDRDDTITFNTDNDQNIYTKFSFSDLSDAGFNGIPGSGRMRRRPDKFKKDKDDDPTDYFKCFTVGIDVNAPRTLRDTSDSGTCGVLVPSYEGLIDVKMAVQVPVIVIRGGKTFATKLGNLLLFIKRGLYGGTQILVENPDKNLQNLFAGEGKAKQENFAATTPPINFSLPGGRNYTWAPGARNKSFTQDQIKDSIVITTAAGSKIIGQVNFEFNKAVLTEAGKKSLEDPILENSLLKAKKSIEIVGHTDGKGGDGPGNQKLSLDRAKAVEEFLKTTDWWKEDIATKKGLKITSTGFSSKQPILDDASGDEPYAAAANRRVEFIIDGNKPKYDEIIKSIEAARDAAKAKK